MAKQIDKVRFFQCGKPAPSGSRFKGIMTQEMLFGGNGYLEYTMRKDANEASINNQIKFDGFLGYTSREEATETTLTHLGYLNAENKNGFLNEAKACFCNKNDLAWEMIVSFESYEIMERAGIYSQQEYGSVVNKVLPAFFKKVGFDPSNMVWWENYHTNKANPHMHIVFMEKNKNRTRGKFTETQRKDLKREIIKETIARTSLENRIGMDYKAYFKEKDELRSELISQAGKIDLNTIETLDDLYMILPKSGRIQYGSKQMEKYRPAINKVIDKLLTLNEVKPDYDNFIDKVKLLDETMNQIAGTEIGTIGKTEKAKLYKELGNLILNDYKESYGFNLKKNFKIDDTVKDALVLINKHDIESAEAYVDNMEDTPNKTFVSGKLLLSKGNVIEGLKMLENAANQGQLDARFELGVMYLKGDKVERNKELGQSLIEEAVKGGHKTAKKFNSTMQRYNKAERKQRFGAGYGLLTKIGNYFKRRVKEIEDEIFQYLYGNQNKEM